MLPAIVSGIPVSTRGYDLGELANAAIALLLVVAAALCFVYILFAGIKLIVSGGDTEKVQGALATFRYALIGFVLVIIAFTIVTMIGRFFGIDFVGYLSWEHLLRIVNIWTGRVEDEISL